MNKVYDKSYSWIDWMHPSLLASLLSFTRIKMPKNQQKNATFLKGFKFSVDVKLIPNSAILTSLILLSTDASKQFYSTQTPR